MSATKHKETRGKDGAAGGTPAPAGGAGPQKAEAGQGSPVEGGSVEARRRAAVILEVLAGQLRPSEAAAAAGVSITRYYMLEAKALEGLVEACEPAPRGPTKTPQAHLAELQRKHAHLQHECARYQAIARAAQRSLGLSLPGSGDGPERKGPKGRRLRAPSVRGLRFAERLKADLPPQEGASEAKPPASE
jgi:hypothetical protein